MNTKAAPNNIGVMQGRLLPKYQKRYQAHPVGYWQQEFDIAAENKLSCIEFILDYNRAEENPLLTQEGNKEILARVAQTGVSVNSICADYFMEAPIHHTNSDVVDSSISVLNTLIERAATLNVKDFVIPCV